MSNDTSDPGTYRQDPCIYKLPVISCLTANAGNAGKNFSFSSSENRKNKLINSKKREDVKLSLHPCKPLLSCDGLATYTAGIHAGECGYGSGTDVCTVESYRKLNDPQGLSNNFS